MFLTFGAELEFADVKYGQLLPEGNVWNTQDYSIVNSNGIANCSIGKYYGFGGEINTRPTDTVEEQKQVFEQILAILDPKPVINYRCNLHIHVGLRGLRDDLYSLKKLLSYLQIWQVNIFNCVEYIPKPTHGQYLKDDAYKGAMKRYRRRFASHQSVLKPEQYDKMLKASTTEEFYLSHFVTDKRGIPQKQLHQRCGINLRSLWENDETVEFRHFPGTLNPAEFRSCVSWCEEFMYAALVTQEPPMSIMNRRPDIVFPKFVIYNHALEESYLKTCHNVPVLQREENIKRLSIETA